MTAPRFRPRRAALARGGQVLALAAATLLAASLPSLAAAQASAPATDLPTRPVRILTPFPAGAGP